MLGSASPHRLARLSTSVAAVAALLVACPAAADSAAARALADRVLDCTVGISCTTPDGGSFTGTGTVISPDGHILTATSVVPGGATDIATLAPGYARRPATIVAVDDALSATIIKVDAKGLPFLPLARELPALGTVAYTAGDVDGVILSNGRASFSRGVISGIYPVTKRGEALYEGIVLETTAAVNPGSDGGPLVDAAGRVCGVISLSISPLRWQGVAVPATVLRERFAPLASSPLAAIEASSFGAAAEPATLAGLRRAAAAVAPFLAGIEVDRTWKPEILPSTSWDEHRRGIEGWEKLARPEKLKRFATFANMVRGFEVNQLLRRPPGPTTGVVVSPNGFILTSLFNVGGDTAFVSTKTGQPRTFSDREPPEKLAAPPEGGIEQKPNPITKITVVLPDGSRREANVHARHHPLGIAVLKVEAEGLPWFDLAGMSTSPQLGDAVGLVGRLPSGTPPYTLNPGVVSAAARNRGYQFQTDALFNYGNSGGPVVDAAGNFLGIATAPIEPDTVLGRLFPMQELMRWTRAPNSGVGMVARADRIRSAFEDLKGGKSFDRIPGPFIGLQADQQRALGEDVVIGGVAAGSPAAKAGLKKGDRILEYNGTELRDWRDLTDRVAAAKAGDEVTLQVQRRGSGPRLVIAGRDVETLEDLQRLRKSLQPGETFEGVLSADDTREFKVVLEENK
jgi:S1-C subfamily serine protease